jgi:hypothetical protein
MMKYACFVISIFVVSNAIAALEKGPLDLFSFTKLNKNKTTVEVVAVDNVQKYCEQESIKRGNGGFKGAPLQACSFWTHSTCYIVVPKLTNNDMLGHELRHCFQGNFH